MSYLRPSLAMNVGTHSRSMAMAPRRALATEAWDDGGRIGRSNATDSSFANISEATRKKASALRRGVVAKWASTRTRSKTNSALGGGRSSASVGGPKSFSGTESHARLSALTPNTDAAREQDYQKIRTALALRRRDLLSRRKDG